MLGDGREAMAYVLGIKVTQGEGNTIPSLGFYLMEDFPCYYISGRKLCQRMLCQHKAFPRLIVEVCSFPSYCLADEKRGLPRHV